MTDPANNTVLNLKIDGMHCGACVRRVTAALQKLPDTVVDSVEVGTATVHGSPDPEALLDALKKAGFTGSLL